MINDIKTGRKTKREYQGVVYDSLEEVYIRWYLDELLEAGIIRDIKYQPNAIILAPSQKYSWDEVLKTKVNTKQSQLLEGATYTYDYRWRWVGNFKNLFTVDIESMPYFKKGSKKPYFLNQYGESHIDVKGSFANRGSNLREFEVKRKWLYFKIGLFVQKIIPEKLFEATFTPERYLYCNKLVGKLRTIHFEVKTLDMFLNQKQQNTH